MPTPPSSLAADLRDARDALARAARTSAALAEITARLTSLREPSAVLQLTVEEAVRLLGAFGAALGLFDPAAGAIRWAYHAGLDEASAAALARLDIPVGQGITGRAFEDARLAFTDDYVTDPRFEHLGDADSWIAQTGVRSMVAAPLPAEAGPLGILAIFSTRAAAFGEAERATIETLANQASIALENARRIEEIDRSRADLARRAEIERTLREIGGRLAALHDPTEVLRRIVDEAARLVDADAVAVDILDRATNRISSSYDATTQDANVHDLVLNGQRADLGVVGLALSRDAIAVTGNYLDDDSFSHIPDADAFMTREGIQSMAAAPLRSGDGPIGVVDFYSRRRDAFGPAEISIIGAFADQASIALSNAHLIDELARSREAVTHKAATERSLSEIAARVAAARDPQLILQTVADEACRLIGADGAHLTLLADDGATLVPAVVAGGSDPASAAWLTTSRFSLGSGLHGRAAATREVLWTDDSLRDRDQSEDGRPHTRNRRLPPGRAAIRAVAVAPLNAPDGAVLGTLAISYTEARDIDEEARRLLATLADLAVVAIMNSRLESGLRARAADLAASEERARLARELHDSVTQALFSMTLQTRAAELLLERDPAAAAEKLASLRDLQRDALAEMRSLIFELRPSGIAEQGLVHALRTHTAAIEGRIGLPVAFETTLPAGPSGVPLDVEEAVYRIAQEALHNVVRHARARRVEVRLGADEREVRLSVVDDGVGFDPDAVPPGHLGVDGMRARAERLGGSLSIETGPGAGTSLAVVVPLPERAAGA
ncbi:MAG TPA: GAF domain-containing protein [Candidatus Acidoferrales bacterium]|nr:GAF domain-containing protein [Candidatus Acidoferrales bacterium]